MGFLEINESAVSNLPYCIEGDHFNVAIEIYMFTTLQFLEYTHTIIQLS